MQQTAEEAVAELPKVCDRGVKKNAKGYTETWNGFKLHVDVNDTGLPLSAILTSASVHDSQVAIPLMKLTNSKVQSCYDLMDAAYDAQQIWALSKGLGHVPIIDRNPRNGEPIPMSPRTFPTPSLSSPNRPRRSDLWSQERRAPARHESC